MNCQVYRRNLSVSPIMFPFTRRSTFAMTNDGELTAGLCGQLDAHLPAYGPDVPAGLIENSMFVDCRGDAAPSASKRSVVYGRQSAGAPTSVPAQGDRRAAYRPKDCRYGEVNAPSPAAAYASGFNVSYQQSKMYYCRIVIAEILHTMTRSRPCLSGLFDRIWPVSISGY